MKRRAYLQMVMASALIGGISTARAAEEPTIDGTWELNVEKSKTTGTMPKSITRTYKTVPGGEELTGTIVAADGKSYPVEFKMMQDGKDYPFKEMGNELQLSGKKADPYTVNFALKKDGKELGTGTRVLSNDGKTMTI